MAVQQRRAGRGWGCVWGALALLCLWEGARAREVFRRSRPAPTPAPTPAPANAYLRFHANDSYVGRDVPCTDDEKVCFRYNLVLDTDSDTCQRLGEGYTGGCGLRVDRREFQETFGRVYGVCQAWLDPCEGYRMAWDGRCYTKELVRNVLCGCAAGPTRHLLGDFECRCTAPTRVRVEQPREAGRCRIPDLRFPDVGRKKFRRTAWQRPQNVNCSAQQRQCFAQGKVWVEAGRGCFPLLKRGPCALGEVVVLNKQRWTSGAAECVNARGGCAPGRLRMAFDGNCHPEREMKIAAPGRLALNIVGEYDVLGYNEGVTYTPSLHDNACTFGLRGVNGPPPGRHVEKPVCTGREPECALYETFSRPVDA